MYGSEGSELTLAAAGDAILTRRWSACEAPRFRRLIERIRRSDAAFVNLEVLLHDYDGYPAATSGGTYMRAPPAIADELTWAGFDLFGAATNHAADYSHGGMHATMRALDDRDLTYAGLGKHLAGARAPAYVDTPAGRIGLVAACTTLTPGSEAGQQRPDIGGRPGVNPLRLDSRFVVPADVLDEVRDLAALVGVDRAKESRIAFRSGEYFTDEDDDRFYFLDPGSGYLGTPIAFEAGDPPQFDQTPNEDDAAAITRRIEEAERQADWVIASLHTHEGVDGTMNDASVPGFLETFAHACIDAGADAFVGHGPHVLRGIEVYDGAPILYSLGNFAFQLESIPRFPTEQYDDYDLGFDALPSELYDARMYDTDGDPDGTLANDGYWETIVPVLHWEAGEFAGADLYPVDLGQAEPRPRRGRPAMAAEPVAERIIDSVAELSAPFDTTIEFSDNRGVLGW